jgi:hypothetical protein
LAKTAAVSLPKLPKGSLKRLNIGQSFAEYDIVRDKAGVVVDTPAMRAALDRDRSKCLFVGRRGTGKTAITFQVQASPQRSLLLLPQLFSPVERFFGPADMENVHQRPFRLWLRALRGLWSMTWWRHGYIGDFCPWTDGYSLS